MKKLLLTGIIIVILLSVGLTTAQTPVYEAEVLTEWAGTGTEIDPYRPAVGDDFALVGWEDTTGQGVASLIPEPNLYIVRVECSGDVLAEIEADPDYGEPAVLWSEEMTPEVVTWLDGPRALAQSVKAAKPKNGDMSANEFGQLRAFLAKKKMSQAEIKAAVGDVTGRRDEVVERLRVWLRGL